MVAGPGAARVKPPSERKLVQAVIEQEVKAARQRTRTRNHNNNNHNNHQQQQQPCASKWPVCCSADSEQLLAAQLPRPIKDITTKSPNETTTLQLLSRMDQSQAAKLGLDKKKFVIMSNQRLCGPEGEEEVSSTRSGGTSVTVKQTTCFAITVSAATGCKDDEIALNGVELPVDIPLDHESTDLEESDPDDDDEDDEEEEPYIPSRRESVTSVAREDSSTTVTKRRVVSKDFFRALSVDVPPRPVIRQSVPRINYARSPLSGRGALTSRVERKQAQDAVLGCPARLPLMTPRGGSIPLVKLNGSEIPADKMSSRRVTIDEEIRVEDQPPTPPRSTSSSIPRVGPIGSEPNSLAFVGVEFESSESTFRYFPRPALPSSRPRPLYEEEEEEEVEEGQGGDRADQLSFRFSSASLEHLMASSSGDSGVFFGERDQRSSGRCESSKLGSGPSMRKSDLGSAYSMRRSELASIPSNRRSELGSGLNSRKGGYGVVVSRRGESGHRVDFYESRSTLKDDLKEGSSMRDELSVNFESGVDPVASPAVGRKVTNMQSMMSGAIPGARLRNLNSPRAKAALARFEGHVILDAVVKGPNGIRLLSEFVLGLRLVELPTFAAGLADQQQPAAQHHHSSYVLSLTRKQRSKVYLLDRLQAVDCSPSCLENAQTADKGWDTVNIDHIQETECACVCYFTGHTMPVILIFEAPDDRIDFIELLGLLLRKIHADTQFILS